jgi:hypothetical protein
METAALTANSEVATAVVDLFADDNQVSAGVRMGWICYSNFFRRNPCIMSPLRTKARRPGLCIANLIETCKLNDVEPFGYLRSTLEAIAQGHPMKRLDELLPGPFATKSMH